MRGRNSDNPPHCLRGIWESSLCETTTVQHLPDEHPRIGSVQELHRAQESDQGGSACICGGCDLFSDTETVYSKGAPRWRSSILRSTSMKRTRRNGPGTLCRIGPITSRGTRGGGRGK